MGMERTWELPAGKIWEWDLSFRWELKWDGNEVNEMGGNWDEKSVPAHHRQSSRAALLYGPFKNQ